MSSITGYDVNHNFDSFMTNRLSLQENIESHQPEYWEEVFTIATVDIYTTKLKKDKGTLFSLFWD